MAHVGSSIQLLNALSDLLTDLKCSLNNHFITCTTIDQFLRFLHLETGHLVSEFIEQTGNLLQPFGWPQAMPPGCMPWISAWDVLKWPYPGSTMVFAGGETLNDNWKSAIKVSRHHQPVIDNATYHFDESLQRIGRVLQNLQSPIAVFWPVRGDTSAGAVWFCQDRAIASHAISWKRRHQFRFSVALLRWQYVPLLGNSSVVASGSHGAFQSYGHQVQCLP